MVRLGDVDRACLLGEVGFGWSIGADVLRGNCLMEWVDGIAKSPAEFLYSFIISEERRELLGQFGLEHSVSRPQAQVSLRVSYMILPQQLQKYARIIAVLCRGVLSIFE